MRVLPNVTLNPNPKQNDAMKILCRLFRILSCDREFRVVSRFGY